MKPLKNTIPIRELQTLIRQWRQRGLRETTLLKVLELYLGLPEYMNAQGEYPVHFFYKLSIALKFRTVTMMLECVKMSGSFRWKPGNNKMNMASFCSPLWIKKDEKASESPAKMQVLPADLQANLQAGSNIYNNINISSPPEVNPSEEGRNFFHIIKAQPTQKAKILDPLIRYFQLQEPTMSHQEACADVVFLVKELLIPHFIAQEKFLRMKHGGRLAWLKNLLKSAHGQELLKKAADAGRQRRNQQKQQALADVKQNNRPVSPHEWMDPQTGTRFYEDETEGNVVIPENAPPRPNDEVFWNVIQKSWNEF